MKYIRSRPWRSRGPWFSNRAGARRRGHREGDLSPVADFPDGDDEVIAVQSEATAVDDVLLAEAVSTPHGEGLLAAHVDMSGLRAMAVGRFEATPIEPDQHTLDTLLSPDWFAHTERSDDPSLSRHSA